MPAIIFRILAVSFLVFLAGWLGLKMAVPPGYASPLWPPAGISLAALLLGGRRLWPAIWIGSFANNLLAGFDINGHLSWSILASSTLIGLGSTLQALTAACLSRKFVAPDIPQLDNPRQVLTFFLLTGPLACLVAPCIGTTSLFLQNLMPATELLISWWNWWVGDSLGVLLVTPLIFCLFAQPRPLWQPRILRVALPLLVTLLALATAFVFVFRAEQARLQMAFDNQASAIERLLINYVHNVLNSTQALRDLHLASDNIDRQEFSLFARGLLSRHPEIQALEWLPRITASQLPAFERAIRAEGYPDFKVTERTIDGSLRAVDQRDVYFPILYVEPMLGNEKVFGFDSISNLLSRDAKQKARLTGQPSVSEGTLLIQRNDNKIGVLISLPVFARAERETISDQLIGFVSAVILPERMLRMALQGMDSEMFGITLRDLDATPKRAELFVQSVNNQVDKRYALQYWQRDFLFGDRTWQLNIIADRRFLAEHGSILPWATLVGGLCFASLLSILLLTISGRTAQAEALINIRSLELEAANAELKAIANDLKASELKLRTVIQSQPECVKLVASDGTLLEMNPAGLAMIGADNLEQIKAAPLAQLVLPQYRQAFNNCIRQVFAGQSVSLEFEIVSLKGVHRWLDTHAVPLYNSEDQVIALLGLTRDISERKRMEITLHENQQKLSNILNNISACIYLKDTEGRYLYVNRAICELWDTDEADIIGFSDEKFFDAETALKLRENDQQVLIVGKTLHTEETNLIQKTGKIATFWSTKLPLRNEQGEIYALIGISTDITERKKAEDDLRLAARVFGEAHEGILITDAKANIIDVNPTFCEITGYNRDEVIGKNPRILQSGSHGPEFYRDMWNTLIGSRHWRGEVWNRKKNGELYAELLSMSALCNEQGQVINYIGLFSDITPVKQQQQMLEFLAHYDPLTQLPNRTLFADRLAQAIAHSRREKSLLAICFLDLDGFKPVNDQFGHNTGDRLLVEVSERLKLSLREQDSVSRHGGDEFALLLGDLHSIEECTHTLARIHQAVIEPYLINDHSIYIGVSSGITIYPLDDADPDTLLRHADHAMYQAKLSGKNRYHLFDASQDQMVIDHHKQLTDIEAAFADRQFCLYYQPKVNLKSGLVTGAEALIRWRHPERGLLAPAEFLPMIASSELEISIGNWVIEQAWRQLCTWQQLGLNLEVSVNISAYHLLWPGFIEHLKTILAVNPSVSSRLLQLEILESTALDDLSAVNRVVRICRDALGVTTALDDFGTGYSSLTHLRHLSVNAVKIDKSFVRDMLDDPDDYAIVDSVISLSQAFRHQVIAEGVETQEQGLMLLLMDCHLAQGYAIAKPMPADAVPEWIAQYQPYPQWQAYANKKLTPFQIQISIRRIDLDQWLQRMNQCLTSHQNNISHWPILVPSKSHFGRWLKQAGYQDQYNKQWLEQLAELHTELLNKADVLMHQFSDGDAEGARAGFVELKNIQQRLDACLATYA